MLKYLVLAAVFAAFVFAFAYKPLFEHFGKKDVSLGREIIVKSVCFLIVLLGAVYIMFVQ